MMNIFRKIKRFLFGPKTEIYYVRRSLKQHEYQVIELESDFDPEKDCCLDCMTGGHYTRLKEKIKRIKTQLNRLERRKKQ